MRATVEPWETENRYFCSSDGFVPFLVFFFGFLTSFLGLSLPLAIGPSFGMQSQLICTAFFTQDHCLRSPKVNVPYCESAIAPGHRLKS